MSTKMSETKKERTLVAWHIQELFADGQLKNILSVGFPGSSTVYKCYVRYYGLIKIQHLTRKFPILSENFFFVLLGVRVGRSWGYRFR